MPGAAESDVATMTAEPLRIQARRPLPAWPIVMLFAGYPVLWVLGLGGFAATVAALPMLGLLVLRSQVKAPAGFFLWLVFMGWTVLAATQLDTGGRMIGYAFRFLSYSSAAIIFVYLWNTSRELPVRRVVGLMVAFLAFVVFGGYLGVLIPKGSFTTPFEMVMPGAIKGNSYVRELVHPKFAEIQFPWGAPAPFKRPSAPFAYTNTWGSHFALLSPFAFAYASMVTQLWRKAAAVLLVVAGLVPASATLNRGMFLSLGIGVVYCSLRLAARGHVRLMMALTGLLSTGLYAAYTLGVFDMISSRTSTSSTNEGRAGIYAEAFNRTLDSPMIGAGAPRPSLTMNISVGTQGQFWNVMFSYGFVGLALFCGFLWWLAVRTRGAPGPLIWLHTVTVMASFMLFFYGIDGTQLVLVFVAGALVLRPPAPPLIEGRG